MWNRICCVCLVSFLAACTTPTAPAQRPKLTIAWISKTLGNPVFDSGQRGALQKAQELSATGNIQVEVLNVGPVTADAFEQARVVDDMIARGVDGIAISCNDPTACIDPINKAIAAGIPVMTWDSDSPQSQRFTFLSIDNYGSGKIAADMLAKELNAKGQVAVLTGVPGGWNLDERVRGFKERLTERYPDMQVVATLASNEDINLGVQMVEETMQAHPNLNGWFFAGMWPLFAGRGSMTQWEKASQQGRIKTVAFDSLPLELNLLQDGYLSVLIGQKYWKWGYDSIQIMYDRLVHQQTFPTFIDTGLDIVTRKNVDAMKEAWETNDFSKPLPAP